MPNVTLLLQKPWAGVDKSGKKIRNPEKTRIYAYLLLPTGDSSKKKSQEVSELSEEERKEKQKERNKFIIKIKSDFVVLPEFWDFKRQQLKGTGAPEYNRRLLTWRQEVEKEYERLNDDPAGYTLDQIKALMKDFGTDKVNPHLKKTKSLFDVYEEFLKAPNRKGKLKSYRTIQKFNTLKSVLNDLSKTNPKYKTLTFNSINHAFMLDFLSHLWVREPRGRQKNRPEGEQDGLLTDTVGKYLECFRTFLKWATLMEYNTNLKFEKFPAFLDPDLKKQDEDNVALTLSEFKSLYNHEFPEGSALEHARDVFCFATFTGQRDGDVRRFKKSDLDGDVWTFKAEKTNKRMQIDLIGFAAPAMKILKKYNYELPMISLQKFNGLIKQAAAAAGIDAPTTLTRYVGSKKIELSGPKSSFVSSHCARRTCVSLLLNNFGVPVTVVKQITGHSDLSTLQKYIITDREEQRRQMSRTMPITETLTVKRNAV